MSHLRDLAHRRLRDRPVAAWLVLVFGIAFPVLGVLLLLPSAIPVDPVLSLLAFVLLSGGAVLVTAWADGRDGVRRLLGGLIRWRIGVARWLLVLFALPALTLGIAAATRTLRSPAGGWAGMLLGYLVPGVLAGAVTTNLWEEAGWSGLVQSRLMSRHGLVRGALLTAIPFALIHVPVAFANNDAATAVVDLVAIALVAPIFRYLIGVVLIDSGGSILAAGLLHASLNASGRLSAAEGGWQVIPALALLAVLVAVFRRSSRGVWLGLHGDRSAAWLAAGFILLLLASEAALTLPDERATSAAVADFYSGHRLIIVVLQLVGFVAAGLLGCYAWRLRRFDPIVARAGVALALISTLPGMVTAITALVADPRHPSTAGWLNQFEPRADDALFAAVIVFSVAIVLRCGRRHRWLGAAAGLTAACCIGRLALEVAGSGPGPLESVAPIAFLLLIGLLAGMSSRGVLKPAVRTPNGVLQVTSQGGRGGERSTDTLGISTESASFDIREL